MGNLGDGSAVVLNDPRGQVSGVVVVVLIAVAGNTVGLVFGRKAELPQTVIGVIPIGAVHLIYDLLDVPDLVIGILEAGELCGAALCRGIVRLRAHRSRAGGAARGKALMLRQHRTDVPLRPPEQTVIAVVDPAVIEQRHAGQAAVRNAVGGILVVIEALRCAVNDAGNGIGEAFQTVFGVINVFRLRRYRAIVRLVAVDQTIQTVIFIVYRLTGGYVKLFEENSPVRAAGGLSLRL